VCEKLDAARTLRHWVQCVYIHYYLNSNLVLETTTFVLHQAIFFVWQSSRLFIKQGCEVMAKLLFQVIKWKTILKYSAMNVVLNIRRCHSNMINYTLYWKFAKLFCKLKKSYDI